MVTARGSPAMNLLSKPFRGAGMAKSRVRMRAVSRADGPRASPGLSQLQIVQEQSLMRHKGRIYRRKMSEG